MISQLFYRLEKCIDVCSIGTSEWRYILQISKMIYAILANLRLVGNSKGFNNSEIELKKSIMSF